jgi:hypothetical protein
MHAMQTRPTETPPNTKGRTMTDLLTTPDTGPNGQIRRDRWGRYLLPHPDTGIEQAWTRVTTLSSTLADRFGLEKWMQRNIVYGLGQRQDLYARAAAARLEDRDTLTHIVDEAQAAAADKADANFGSAIHQFTERIDRGEPVNVPAPYDKDVAAYRAALEAAEIAVVMGWVEKVVCVPHLEVAGTLDRLVEGPWPHGLPAVADLKTGKDVVNYGMTEIALQLALYANASHWWDGTQWHPMIAVNRKQAIVIHLPVGQARCTLYTVDIQAGWEAVQLAVAVRAWRARKDLAQQIPAIAPAVPVAGAVAPTPPSSPVVSGDRDNQAAMHNQRLADTFGLEIPEGVPGHMSAARTNWIRARVGRLLELGHGDRLAREWSRHPDVPTFKQGGPTTNQHIDQISAMCDQVEADTQVPFGPSDPTTPPVTKAKVRAQA